MSLFLLLSAKHNLFSGQLCFVHNLFCSADCFALYATVDFLHSFQRIVFAYNPKNVA